jgi:hypothetical protein
MSGTPGAARRILLLVLALCSVLVLPAMQGPEVRAAGTASSSLPAGSLQFGLANDPSDLSWMTSSGVPWAYRYQYISGGVNTSGNWETWQDPSQPPGQFAIDYVTASHDAGYIPVFSWYELLQSSPSSGSDESDRDFSNLNDATTMASYYASFALLMQCAAQAGGTVIVQVEPDLWGYLQQRAAGGDAASLAASVASSGYSGVAGYANTAAGFGAALIHLRNVYAPNVLLAVHASMWSSGIDISSDTSPAVNAAAEADKTAAFLMSTGSWDLVFNDVDDHDAGWWEAQGDDSSSFTHWWDPTNQVFPNFQRYLEWVAELHTKTGIPQVAWQVPIGNQYYLTMNNTCGHYQDNVAQYFIGHASDLYAAGLIAVLFGAGNACQTTYTDADGDGVTNNGGVPTTDALGGCIACNTNVSTVSDDDGGYLRTAVGAYYAATTPPPPATRYQPLTPYRVLDTRSATCVQCGAGALGQGQTRTIQVGGYSPLGYTGTTVPAGATAVVLNVTAVSGSAGTYLTVFPAGEAVPNASTLNPPADDNVANLVTVTLGSSGASPGYVNIYNHLGSIDVVADVEGYYTTAAGSSGEFHPLSPPVRVCDTRGGQGTACNTGVSEPLSSGQSRLVAVTDGSTGVPTSGDAEAAVLNLTAVNGTAGTFLTVYPPISTGGTPSCGVPPTASNLNVAAGATQPNRVIAPVLQAGGAGYVCVFNHLGTVNVVVDVGGWYGNGSDSGGASFYPISPSRICDTRDGSGTECAGKTLGQGGTDSVQVDGTNLLPASGVVALVANVTAVSGTAATFLTVYPDAGTLPGTSDLNPPAATNIANLVIVAVPADGEVNVYNHAGTIDVVIDAVGWFQ